MPSERFFKLPEEKRERILRSGFREFCRGSVAVASINRIAREAEISRGSFYTYFEDKADLFCHIMETTARSCRERMLELLKRDGGDLFLCARDWYELCCERLRGSDYIRFFENIREFYMLTDSCPPARRGELREEYLRFCGRVLEALDRERYEADAERLAQLLPIIELVTLRGAALAASCPEGEEMRRREMEMTLDVLKYGALRRGN